MPSLTAVALTLIFVSGIAVYNKFFGKNNSAVIKDKNGTTATIGEDGLLHVADKEGNKIEYSPIKFVRYLKKVLNSDISRLCDILHDAIVRSFIDDDIQFPDDLNYSDYPNLVQLGFIFKNFLDFAVSIFKRSNVISYLKSKGVQHVLDE
ncbi:hypothetical protein [Candidatus Endomicrobiellum agilis]|uniref:hypothetical protein n=1 Tax=Candidatus Endomicrobiellum agilis TaxID=3238957 RepID=UPI0035A9695F